MTITSQSTETGSSPVSELAMPRVVRTRPQLRETSEDILAALVGSDQLGDA